MDERAFRVKAVKSVRNARKKFGNNANFKVQERAQDFDQLTTKSAVKFLLEGTLKYRVCRYCLCVASKLSEPDEIYEVARKGAIYKVTLRDMIACVHPFKVADDPNFPDKICDRCVESAISSYIFSQQCERSERALRNCFDDMYEKFEKLDPVERGKKRGRQKANPNPNVLYAEHEKVIDYAEPIINIVNLGAINKHNEPEISDLECPKCWLVLPDIEALLNHENRHPKSMWYSCRLCGESFVKIRQYKKHVRTSHSDDFLTPATTDPSIKCSECGYSSSGYSEHLLHMEKHKFKTTFEHLINRNMERLCSVCLEKKTCMVHMNEIIHLNGGYPGLNNETMIYSVVTSTFPERKSYKYQELLIPTRARVMTITKRMDPKKNFTALYDKDKNMFSFSLPIVLSTLNIDFEPIYVFIFSDPYLFSELRLPTLVTNNLNFNKAPNLPLIHNNVVSKALNQDNYSNDPNDSAKNIVDNKTSSKSNEKTKDFTVELCKTCWIFNKPSCNKCIGGIDHYNDVSIDKDSVETSNNVQEKCNYCWLFESVGKCNTCNKILRTDTEINHSNMQSIDNNVNGYGTQNVKADTDKCKYCYLFKSKCIYCKKVLLPDSVNTLDNSVTQSNSECVKKDVSKTCKDDNVIQIKSNITQKKDEHITDKSEIKHDFSYDTKNTQDFESQIIAGTRKRKANIESVVPPKLKWQCKICLTNNDVNRQTCFCCEFDTCILDNKVKFNFGTNKHLFEIKSQTDTPNKVQEVNNEEHTKSSDDDKPVEVTKPPQENVTEITNQADSMDIEMDTPIETKSDQKDELMDVTYEEEISKLVGLKLNFPTNNDTFANNTISAPMNFKFNIGSVHSNDGKQRCRRIMRPMRRMANMGRK